MIEKYIKNKIGIIYPATQKNIKTLKKRKKPVFVKYITYDKSKNATKLRPGDFLLLYVSQMNKSITHYSKISSVSFKSCDKIMRYYLYRIQMNKNEFKEYVQDRKNKLLLFLELEKLTELKKQYFANYPITMSGKYVSESDLYCIIGKVGRNDKL